MLYRALVQGMRGIKIISNLRWILNNICWLNTPWHPRSKSHASSFSPSFFPSQNYLQMTLPRHQQFSCDKVQPLTMSTSDLLSLYYAFKASPSSLIYIAVANNFKINHPTFPKMLKELKLLIADKRIKHIRRPKGHDGFLAINQA